MSGQQHELKYVIADQPLAKMLAVLLGAEAQSMDGMRVFISSPNSYSQCLHKAAVRIFGEKGKKITAYSVRHAAAADFKANLSPDDTSAALGHIWVETKTCYGSHTQGKGATSLNPRVNGAKELNRRKSHTNPPWKPKPEAPTIAHRRPSPFS